MEGEQVTTREEEKKKKGYHCFKFIFYPSIQTSNMPEQNKKHDIYNS